MGEEEPAVQSYEGERNDAGQRHGSGTATFANGDKYTGGYVDGLRCGEGVYDSAAGDKYTGGYAENLRHGAGVMAYADGSTYEGAWCRGYRHGEGIYDYANGDYYEGAWAGGAKHGLGVYFFAESRSQFHGYWDCGSFLGGTWTHQDGTVYVGAFEKAVDVSSLPSTFYTPSGNSQSMVCAGSRWDLLGSPTSSERPALPVLLESLGLESPKPFAAMKKLAPGMIVPPPRVIVAGAPASGKGEQCEKLLDKYGLKHISTGSVIRDAILAGSDLGKEAQAYMLAGQSVPDELLTPLVKEALDSEDCEEHGWLLDGFPRTQVQAQSLKDAGIAPSVMLVLDVPDKVLINNCVHRRLDPHTGDIYDILTNPPPEGEVADRVVQRRDDNEEVVRARLHSYHETVESVAGVFLDVVRSVDANRSSDAVFAEVCARINGDHVPPRVMGLGAPASGKGKHCENILNKFGLAHVTPAGVIRAAIRAQPPNEEYDAAQATVAELTEQIAAQEATVQEHQNALDEATAAAVVEEPAEGEEPAEVPAEAAAALEAAQAACDGAHDALVSLQEQLATAQATAIELQGPLLTAMNHMALGETVPDELLMPLMIEHLRSEEIRASGWLLDGFPRTASQADALAAAECGPHVVLMLDCPDNLVLERLEGRRLDPETGTIYHMTYSPPEDEEVLARLVQRKDDRREVIQSSLDEFHTSANEVTGVDAVFNSRVRRVDCSRTDASIDADIVARLEGRAVAPKIIIAGAPGSGKGKQSEWLIAMLGVEHVTTGTLLRAAITSGTELGQAAQAALQETGVVPDDVLTKLVVEKLNSPETTA
eukprot:COSAG02_NODE_570_length_20203_cov_8.049990_1_plen_822_part_00